MKIVALFSVETKELLFATPAEKWANISAAFYLAFDSDKIFPQEFDSLSLLQEFLKVPSVSVYENGILAGTVDIDEIPLSNLTEIRGEQLGEVIRFMQLGDLSKRYFIAGHKSVGDPDYLSYVYAIEQLLVEKLESDQATIDATYETPADHFDL